MFTGIVETVGIVKEVKAENTNRHFQIESPISNELKVDQSISHNGVCLTVTKTENGSHWVTAIHETLQPGDPSALALPGRRHPFAPIVAPAPVLGHG